jgi:hypothetical protein
MGLHLRSGKNHDAEFVSRTGRSLRRWQRCSLDTQGRFAILVRAITSFYWSGSGLVAVMRYSAAASELEVVWNLTLSVASVNYRARLIRFTYG